jgi:cell wall-associated NlpC family hydrolase
VPSPDLILIVSANLLWFLFSACLLGLLVARWSPPASRHSRRARPRPVPAFAEGAGTLPEPGEDSVETAPLAVVLASPLRPLPPPLPPFPSFPSYARPGAAAPYGVPGLRRGSLRWQSAVLASRAWLAALGESWQDLWREAAPPRHAAPRARHRAPAASPRHARVQVRPQPRAWVQGRIRVLVPAAALCVFLASAAAVGASLAAGGPGTPEPGAAVGAEALGLNARPSPGAGPAALPAIIGRVAAGQTAGGRAGRPSARPAGELAAHRTGSSVPMGAPLSAARARLTAVRDVLSWLRRLRSGDALDAQSANERTLADSLGRQQSRLRLTIARLERDLEAAARPQLSDRATLLAAPASRPVSPVAAQASPAPVPAGSGGATGGGGPAAGGAAAVAYAEAQLGKPYVWGGAGPDGYDCSGLVMMAWQAAGISLPHYTVSQWDDTYHISAGQLQPGDLVFSNGFGHVQMYVGHGEVIQAPHTGAVVSYAPLPPPEDVDGYASVRRPDARSGP